MRGILGLEEYDGSLQRLGPNQLTPCVLLSCRRRLGGRSADLAASTLANASETALILY